MMDMPNILIATDFSENSDIAVLIGKKIQKLTGSKISVIHVSGIPLFWDWVPSEIHGKYVSESFRRESTEYVSKQMSEQLRRCEFVCVNEIFFGDPFQELNRIIAERKPSLLIMGSRGQTGIFEVGSLAQKMIATSAIPVLVAKKDISNGPITGLIDPEDISVNVVKSCEFFSGLLSREARLVTIVQDLISLSGGAYLSELLTAGFPEDQKIQITKVLTKEIKNSTQDFKGFIEVIISKKKVTTTLVEYLSDINSAITILSRQKRGATERLILGSTGRFLLERFQGNLLIVPQLKNESEGEDQ